MRYLALIPWLLLAAPPSSSRMAEVIRNGFQYRNLGPFRAGAWVSDLAVPVSPSQAHRYTFYVAARSGGVWKTTNNGTTFQPVFDAQGVSSIGAIALAPSDANIVWVGTGDASCTRSAYWGDGVYKSTDGARTWQHMGLADSHHISRVAVHPVKPDIVFVAAMGHLHTPNRERGVFKSTDGGKTWRNSLYINETTGAIDLVMNPLDPQTLYAAVYECMRFPWRLQDGGPASGVYRTTDGGTSWHKLDNGLPGGTVGRIGLDICRKDPRVLYAVVDNGNHRPPTDEEAGRDRARGIAPAERMIGGEVYRTDDGGTSWRKTNAIQDDVSRKTGYAFNQIRVDPVNPDRVFITGSNLIRSDDGGKTWAGLNPGPRPFRRAFGDFRTLWIDPENPARMIAGSDGGVYTSYDAGMTCDHHANLPLGEVYAVGIDMDDPYHIYAGLQDHESWKGPSNGWSGSVGMEDWVTVGTGDGAYNQVDPTDSRWLYNNQEFGRHARVDQELRIRTSIQPARPQGQPALRFNWTGPLRISPHNPMTIYAGAQVLFRSLDRGEHWQEISPDLTTNDPERISGPGTGIQFCTITTISESPVTPGIIWVGTDDGKVQMTRDGGVHWNDVTAGLDRAGCPGGTWVSRVAASGFAPGTAYVSMTGRRRDDFRPYLCKTSDFGASWTAITGDLPDRPINVIVEDNKIRDLLFLGNDAGVYVSLDAGGRWFALEGNMPPVPVHDLVVHPREGDLVAGTYGRGIWVTDITPLREISESVLVKELHLFSIRPKARRREGAWGNYRLSGDRVAVTPNAPNGLTFVYYFRQEAEDKVLFTITDKSGATIRTLEGMPKAGLNRVSWDFMDSTRVEVQPGDYTVTLEYGSSKETQSVRVLAPGRPPSGR